MDRPNDVISSAASRGSPAETTPSMFLLGLHGANPNCPVGRRIQIELAAVDRRAAAAVEAELQQTTVAQLVGAADAAALTAG